ncbi:metal ABC transporter substrate-binding protein [Sulfurimonas paralvinellae]|uniref:Zinc ABC transporter substrate-binding protein n=1 Tax=Sulfurimonas paralvinellae TaxID=317658 RepID=A0A7M1BCX4_9BACT|nr:zinc ABC transporter substrate-binding protein [Sulfurimonas paralvinellae]QOP46642.1 zinc ABC transporter substrate-binding protein [Sulfurimonas paralvinellae]
MKNLKIIGIVLVTAIAVLLLFISYDTGKEKNKKPIVAVTTFALYDITKHIAGDTVEVVHILPFGVDPHSFEPTPRLMAKIEKSSLLIYSGAGLEPWVHGFKNRDKMIDMSKYVRLRKLGEDEHELHDHHGPDCIHNMTDPHYWLDFANMQRMTVVITAALSKLLPENKAYYEENKKRYIAMLQKLDKAYRTKLSSCKADTVVVSHNALGYLSRNYGFHVESLTGLSPEAQPSAKDVTRIMDDIQKEGVRTIFFEHFVNDKVIKRIAKDTHIDLEVFQPLGNITKDEAAAHLSYEDIMYRNLDKLSKALVCN